MVGTESRSSACDSGGLRKHDRQCGPEDNGEGDERLRSMMVGAGRQSRVRRG
jgi:hypothetical protein